MFPKVLKPFYAVSFLSRPLDIVCIPKYLARLLYDFAISIPANKNSSDKFCAYGLTALDYCNPFARPVEDM